MSFAAATIDAGVEWVVAAAAAAPTRHATCRAVVAATTCAYVSNATFEGGGGIMFGSSRNSNAPAD